jgi:hypothetical protein
LTYQSIRPESNDDEYQGTPMVSGHHEFNHALYRYAGDARFDTVSAGNGLPPEFISGYPTPSSGELRLPSDVFSSAFPADLFWPKPICPARA